MKRFAVLIVAYAVLTAPTFASGADEITQDDLAMARRERNAVAADLEQAATDYEVAVQRAADLDNAATQLISDLSILEADLANTQRRAAAITRELYIAGRGSRMNRLLFVGSLNDVNTAEQYLAYAAEDDVAALHRYRALRANRLDQQARLVTATAEHAVAVADLDALADDLLHRVESANSSYSGLVAAYEDQEYRKWLATSTTTTTTTAAPRATTTTSAPTTRPPPGSTTTTQTPATTTAPTTTTTTIPVSEPPPSALACPVDGATAFSDSWGALRGSGRTHEGVDMISVRGTPLVAIETGTVLSMHRGGLGGVIVWLRGQGGDTYYYAHLDGWAPGLSPGDDLQVGQLLGYVGNTGNARYTIAHLHFEFHPGGGNAVNPYPLVKGLCR